MRFAPLAAVAGVALAIPVALLSGIESAPSTPVVSDAAPTLGNCAFVCPEQGSDQSAARYYARGTNFSFYFTQIALSSTSRGRGTGSCWTFVSSGQALMPGSSPSARAAQSELHRASSKLHGPSDLRPDSLPRPVAGHRHALLGGRRHARVQVPGHARRRSLRDPARVRRCELSVYRSRRGTRGRHAARQPDRRSAQIEAGGVSVSSRYVVTGTALDSGSVPTTRAELCGSIQGSPTRRSSVAPLATASPTASWTPPETLT